MIVSFLKPLTALIVMTSSLYYILSLLCTISFFRKRPDLGDYLPPVTVLKPLNGTESGIYENLLSHVTQDYPRYQIIFGVNNLEDPVIPVVKRLQGEFPEKDIQLVTSGKIIGYNLKVCNLNNMYEQTKYDVVVMNDSDTRVEPDYLKRVVSPLKDPKVGATTCLYKANGAFSFPSTLESLFTNIDYMPSALVARMLGFNFCFGSTIAIRKKVLEEIGGFPSLADYLAEDYIIGERVIKAGYQVHLSDYVVPNILQNWGLVDYTKHILRWVSTIKSCRPKGYFFRIFTMGTPFSIIFLVISRFSHFALALFLFHLFTRYLTALVVRVRYLKEKEGLGYFCLLPIMDLIIFFIWCWGLFKNKITWRGNTFYLIRGGKLVKDGSDSL